MARGEEIDMEWPLVSEGVGRVEVGGREVFELLIVKK